ncbi:UNVERIFIED_ORG: peptidoglycan/LPS O-acetylase OafA/YrhL [Arthrobacter sp. UYEF13]
MASPAFSSWVNLHDEAPNVLEDAFLLRGSGSLNSPLWSLQWEMLFSLLLPLYVVAAVHIRRAWIPGLAGLFLITAAGSMLYTELPVYLPMFGIGVLMATRQHVLKEWGRQLGRWAGAGVVTASLVLLCSRWLFPQLPVVIAMASIGGAALIFAFIAWPPTITVGDNSMVRWLGIRSFSLYLVHEPIVVSVAFLLGATNPFVVALIAVPMSLLAAEAFFRLVERPSHRLAGAAGRVVTHRWRRSVDTSVTGGP